MRTSKEHRFQLTWNELVREKEEMNYEEDSDLPLPPVAGGQKCRAGWQAADGLDAFQGQF